MSADMAKEIGAVEGNRRTVEREYLNVRELSAYSGLGVRTIWSFLKNTANPLPHIRIGRKIIRIKKTDFDAWVKVFYVRGTGNSPADRIVREVMRDFRKKKRPHSGQPMANGGG